jgi:hypothetical protein
MNILNYLRGTEGLAKARRRYGIRGPAVEKVLDIFVKAEKLIQTENRKTTRKARKTRRLCVRG